MVNVGMDEDANTGKISPILSFYREELGPLNWEGASSRV